jgi:hypothetical protein
MTIGQDKYIHFSTFSFSRLNSCFFLCNSAEYFTFCIHFTIIRPQIVFIMLQAFQPGSLIIVRIRRKFTLLKMFSTQLAGIFKRLMEKEEFSIEDAARLLAQAPAGEGRIQIYATGEMKAAVLEATEGAEPLASAAQWSEDHSVEEISDTDRFLIISRYSDDEQAVVLAKSLSEKMTPFAAISTAVEGEGPSLAELADVHIDLKLTKGLLPDEDGTRFGYPSAIAALFVYHGLKFTIDEILSEYE